jgi:hypothetical protein
VAVLCCLTIKWANGHASNSTSAHAKSIPQSAGCGNGSTHVEMQRAMMRRPTAGPSPACGGLVPTSVMAPTDGSPKRAKIAPIPQVGCMGGLGGGWNGRTRAVMGRRRTNRRLDATPAAPADHRHQHNLPNVANHTRADTDLSNGTNAAPDGPTTVQRGPFPCHRHPTG